jgi:cell division protein FtsB
MFPFLLVLIWPLFLLGVLGGGGYLALRAIRAFERRGQAAPELAALRDRVEVLEQQLESQSEELRRLSDGQQFTERLLADRVGPPR